MVGGARLARETDRRSYEVLTHAVAGTVGGASAITAFYPLNVIRLVEQTSTESGGMLVTAQRLVEKGGVGALFQGWSSSVVALGVSNFVYFYCYNALKIVYQVKVLGTRKKPIDAISNLLIGAVAGIINVLLTTPFWVANTRLSVQGKGGAGGGHGAPKPAAGAGAWAGAATTAVEPYKGVIDCLQRISNEEGFWSLWKGVGSGLMLVSNPSVQFVVYERLRAPLEARAKAAGASITSLQFFVIGAIAKAVATVVTYPIQLAQTRMRNNRDKEQASSSAFWATFKVIADIHQATGFVGLFKGMNSKLWQTVLTAAYQFLVYESVFAAVTRALNPAAAAGKAVKAH